MYVLAKYGHFNTKTIHVAHGYFKHGVFRYVSKSNSFLSDCSSLCPESAYQKSQRVYLYLNTMDLYVLF